MPPITSHQAYGAVLLYPDDETPIGELAAQPFVADYLEDLAEHDREIGRLVAQANQVLIHNGDAVIATCIAFDRPRDYTIAVREPAFAQKQAQQFWTTSAQLQRWDWLKRIRFLPIDSTGMSHVSQLTFDVAYQWMPLGPQDRQVDRHYGVAARAPARGSAFATGSATLREHWKGLGFQLVWEEPLSNNCRRFGCTGPYCRRPGFKTNSRCILSRRFEAGDFRSILCPIA